MTNDGATAARAWQLQCADCAVACVTEDRALAERWNEIHNRHRGVWVLNTAELEDTHDTLTITPVLDLRVYERTGVAIL